MKRGVFAIVHCAPNFGSVNFKIMPNDSAAGRSRYSLRADHEGALPYDGYAQLRVMRVSDWYTHRRSMLFEPFQYNDVRTLECLVSVEPGTLPAPRW